MTIDMNAMIRLREPGLGQQWIGRERYVIRAGAVTAVPMTPGDELEIIDPEGLQSALVFAFNASGESATAGTRNCAECRRRQISGNAARQQRDGVRGVEDTQ